MTETEIEIRPIVLVMGCQKYHSCLESAMKRFSNPLLRVIGFQGDPTLSEPFLDETTQILTVPVNDNYESLPSKVHAAFQWAYKTFPNSPGIWKTDDDIFYSSLEELISQIYLLQKENYWGLVVDQCRDGVIQEWRIKARFENKELRPCHQRAIYCYGHGYWISRNALPFLLSAKTTYDESFLEDVCTGYILNQNRIFPRRDILRIVYKELPRIRC